MKKKITLMISILLLGVIGATYAFFAVDITGEGEDIVVNAGTLRLVYNDGNSVSLLKALPGESVTKTVSVTNTGTLEANYDMSWIDLTNQIENKELVYTVTCTSYINYTNSNKAVNGTCDGKDETAMPTINKKILSNKPIEPGITHEYTITILFKNIEGPQNYNQGKIFNAKINIAEAKNVWYNQCNNNPNNLNCKVIANTNCATNSTVTSCTPQTDDSIQFSQISSDTNGLGLYYTETEGETEDYDEDEMADRVYYYRGAVENNNVIFGQYPNTNIAHPEQLICWRIIRTNEDGSIRMRYNGAWNGTTCPPTGTSVVDDELYNFSDRSLLSEFYSQYDNDKNNEYVQSDGTSSLVKTAVETWYTNNIENSPLNTNNALTNKIANVPYCADKSNPTNSIYSSNETFYGAANRLINYNTSGSPMLSNAQPIFKCNDSVNKHTTSGDTWNGNGRLEKPIGLITADEVVFAGGIWYFDDIENLTYYLNTNGVDWTISPYSWAPLFNRTNIFGIMQGRLDRALESNNWLIYPVLSLKSDTLVSSGNGSYTEPYIVNIN